MRILELNFERTWRGGERQTLYNMLGFRKEGHDVALVCIKSYPLEQTAKDEGFEVFSYTDISGVIAFLTSKGSRYDIIHVQTAHLLTYCVATKLFHRKPIVFSRRLDFVPKGALTRFKYRSADAIVGISTAVKNIVERFSGRAVRLISDIVVAKDLDQDRAEQYLKEKNLLAKHIIGTTAALVPHKDPLTMVETIKKLSTIRQDFIFLHFGSGVLEEEVRAKVAEYKIDKYYKLCGFVDNVEDFFTVFDAFVMSSEEEGLGSSVLDAYIYEVPVISTNAGGLADIVTEDRGVSCEVKDANSLANGIDRVLSNEELKNILVSNAYRYVMKNHSLSYITEQYLYLFKSLLEQG